MACKCIKESEEGIHEHITTELAKSGKVVIPMDMDHNAGYENKLLTFGKQGTLMSTRYEYHFNFKKKDGSTSQKKTGYQTVAFTFCPFCGVAYDPRNAKNTTDESAG